MGNKKVRIVEGNNRNFRTVNVVESGDNAFPVYETTEDDDRRFETVQQSSVADRRFKTVAINGGGGDWWMEGALVDLDFENGRYFMGTERPLSEIAVGEAVFFGGGLNCRYPFAESNEIPLDVSNLTGAAALLTLLNNNLPTGMTFVMEWTDDLADGAPPNEWFGFYDRSDPDNAVTGDAIEFWWTGGALGIDDWDHDFPQTANLVDYGARNKAAITLNVPQGGGSFKNAVCMNGGLVDSENMNVDLSTQHFSAPVQYCSIGYIATSSSASVRGVIHRLTILPPKADADLPSLTTVEASNDVTAPTITSLADISTDENTQIFHFLTANELVSWSIVGGADADLFSIPFAGTPDQSGALSFSAQDFESPADANADNVYEITVRATDAGGNTADQNITVTVLNVED